MSEERTPPPAGTSGLLRGSRTRSYGSLVRSPLSPVRQRRVEHHLQPEDTLQGLSLKYGVSMEQIKRANRLYTNESIFLKRSLWIPVPSDPDRQGDWGDLVGEGADSSGSSSETPAAKERPSDLTPVDFLKRLDGLISWSKQAAAVGCQAAEKRVAAIEAACSSGTSDRRPLTRSQSVVSSPRMQQQQQQQQGSDITVVPLAVTKLTKKLRDREDEIFQL